VSRRSDPKGFIACIPQSGFPLNIAYARKRNSGSNLESAFYWLDPGTYREDSGQREMCYFTKRPNGYHVRVIYNRNRGDWQTEKFRGDSVICYAVGPTFDQAMTGNTEVIGSPVGLVARNALPATKALGALATRTCERLYYFRIADNPPSDRLLEVFLGDTLRTSRLSLTCALSRT
jgi:hypothetical protein